MKNMILIAAVTLAGAGMATAQTATPPTDGTMTPTPAPAETTGTTAATGTTATTTTTATPSASDATTQAATTTTATMPAMSPQEFVTSAASGGLFEVQSSELALERSDTPEVQEFAQMMITDHTKANEELMAIATAKNLTVPGEIAGPPAQHMAAVQAAEGDNFDQVYMQHQAQAHEETIMMFEAQAQNGTDPDLQAFAEKTLPVLKTHAEHAQEMMGN